MSETAGPSGRPKRGAASAAADAGEEAPAKKARKTSAGKGSGAGKPEKEKEKEKKTKKAKKPKSESTAKADKEADGEIEDDDSEAKPESVPARFAGKTLYEVLGLQKMATKDEIKKAYRHAALRIHPDHNKTPSANEEFAYLTKVYEVLSDEKRRQIYDQTGSVEGESRSFESAAEYWRRMFPKVTPADIEAFKKRYVGSDEEREDVANAFNEHKGDMELVLECVPFADAENADRLCAIVEALLKEQSDAGSGSASASGKSKVKAAGKAKVKAAGKGKGNAAGKADAETDAGDDAEDESKEAAESEQKKESESDKPKVVIPKLDTKFQRKFNSTKKGLKARVLSDEGKEAEEAEQHAKDIGVDVNGSLEELIKKRQVVRAAAGSSFLDSLEAKYSKGGAGAGAQKKRKR